MVPVVVLHWWFSLGKYAIGWCRILCYGASVPDPVVVPVDLHEEGIYQIIDWATEEISIFHVCICGMSSTYDPS